MPVARGDEDLSGRGVLALGDDRLELVVGDLNDLRASKAFSAPFDLNYYEVEYSGQFNDWISYELGGERMLDENYLRTELRLTSASDFAWTAEFDSPLSPAGTDDVQAHGRPPHDRCRQDG